MITKTGIDYSTNSDLSPATFSGNIEENGHVSSITIPNSPIGSRVYVKAYCIEEGVRIESETKNYLFTEYFYIQNEYAGQNTITIGTTGSYTGTHTLEYSKDKSTWTTFTMSRGASTSVVLEEGEKLYFRSESGIFNKFTNNSTTDAYTRFSASQNCSLGGNILTLVKYTDIDTAKGWNNNFAKMFYGVTTIVSVGNIIPEGTTIGDYGCYQMFFGCSALTTVNSLPSTQIGDYGYFGMFQNCTSLTSPPSTLPSSQVGNNTYGNMFYGCTSLVTPPSLPATTLTASSYSNMFYNCTAITTAPALPATTLEGTSYYKMFSGCTSLTTPPTFPSTVQGLFGGYEMFQGCTSLVNPPVFPTTINGQAGYSGMFKNCTALTAPPILTVGTDESYFNARECFYNCTSLRTAPALPLTKLVNDECYRAMFAGCTSLTTPPALPATTLTKYCYYQMFSGCTALTSSPALPATTLEEWCYYGMFATCTHLTTSPALPATTLVKECYASMFNGCTILNSVTTYANDISAQDCLTNWLSRVSSTGTFHKLGTASFPSGQNGIPSGWTVVTT